MIDLTKYDTYEAVLNVYTDSDISMMIETNHLWTDLSMSMNKYPDTLEVLITENKNKIDGYNKINVDMKKETEVINTIHAQNTDIAHSNTYILFMTWVFIFFILLFILCIQVVDDSPELNLFSKAFLGLFVLFILYHTISNIYHYMY